LDRDWEWEGGAKQEMERKNNVHGSSEDIEYNTFRSRNMNIAAGRFEMKRALTNSICI
jgi:hypothetical protein